jgi:sulfur carrier protein ThiS
MAGATGKGAGMATTVTAVLFGMHRAFLPPEARPDGRVSLHYERDTVTLADVMRDLAMPIDTVRIVFLDGAPIEADQVLEDGATVTFVSPVSGG